MGPLRGSCLCGGIRYEITGPLSDVLNCHCSMCRKAHGAAFRSRARVDVQSFQWLRGEALVTYYESSPSTRRGFCRACGSPILTRFDGSRFVGLPLGTLDDDPGVKPGMHVFVASKAPWFEITDGLPQFAASPARNVNRSGKGVRMPLLLAFLVPLIVTFSAAAGAQTIEGYWQDIAGRVLSSRHAAPGAVYGTWHERDLSATYPAAKHIRKSGETYQLQDLLYDEKEYSVKVLRGTGRSIEFVRTQMWSGCSMHHACRMEGAELFCSIVNTCRDKNQDVHDWSGEERYVRRSHCERDGGQEAQGIPVKCR